MARYLFVHLSDTHFAARNELLRNAAPSRWGAPGSLIEDMTQRVYRAIVDADASRAAASRLNGAMANYLFHVRRTGDRERGWDIVVVHTGDVTQAGQIASFRSELALIGERSGRTVLTVPGNHDLWPSDFPLFASGRTHMQFLLMRHETQGAFPAQFPDSRVLGSAPDSIQVFRLSSPVPDALENTLAIGRLQEEWHPEVARFQPQLDRLRAMVAGDARLRVALIHHPVAPLGGRGQPAYDAMRRLTSQLVFDLRDRATVARTLVEAGVALVLCGHEHQLTGQVLHEDGRLLQLPGDCPTLERGKGNTSAPYLSLYGVELDSGSVRLGWLVYRVDHHSYLPQATFVYQGGVWRQEPFDDRLFPRTLFDLPRRPPPF